jgi:hypothetical protein
VAYAGPDRTVAAGERVTLDGLGSYDPDGDALSHRWGQTMGPAVALDDADTARPSFLPPEVGVYEFSLTVSDPDGRTDDDVVRISAGDVDPALQPVANAGTDRTVPPGTVVRLDGTGSSDPQGLPLTYAWWQTDGPRVVLEGANAARPSFIAPSPSAEIILTFALLVSNGTLDATDTVNITVSPGSPVQYLLVVRVQGQGTVEPPGGAYDAGTVVSLTATPHAGSRFVRWEGDLKGSTNPTTITMDADKTVTAVFEPSNRPPVANEQTVSTVKNTPLAITLGASDPDGDPLTYAIVQHPQHGILTGQPPQVTYTPQTDYTGSDSFTFKANDGEADSNVATVSIKVTNASGGGGGGPVYFFDDFENGLAKWITSGHDWGLTTATARSGRYSATDSPVGNYSVNALASIEFAYSVDLLLSAQPILRFWHKYDTGSAWGADLLVDVSDDGGSSWGYYHAAIYRGVQSTWSLEQIDLSSYTGGRAVKVRFTLDQVSGGTADGWYIDDVEIRERD